jgi:hypothetical protein
MPLRLFSLQRLCEENFSTTVDTGGTVLPIYDLTAVGMNELARDK